MGAKKKGGKKGKGKKGKKEEVKQEETGMHLSWMYCMDVTRASVFLAALQLSPSSM